MRARRRWKCAKTGWPKQKGIRENKQRIKYDPADVIGCVIRIAAALGEWHKKEAAQFLLMRDVLYEEIASQLEADSFRCRYRLQRGNEYDAWKPVASCDGTSDSISSRPALCLRGVACKSAFPPAPSRIRPTSRT